MDNVGGKSKQYALLRERYDAILPPNDVDRSRRAVLALKQQQKSFPLDTFSIDYDIYNCPPEPPQNYPHEWKLLDILDDWNVDNTSTTTTSTTTDGGGRGIYQGLCVFDYTTDYDRALRYRQAELPFFVQNDPSVLATTERWNYPNYMKEFLGKTKHRTEFSENNHFMYWQPPKKKKNKKTRK